MTEAHPNPRSPSAIRTHVPNRDPVAGIFFVALVAGHGVGFGCRQWRHPMHHVEVFRSLFVVLAEPVEYVDRTSHFIEAVKLAAIPTIVGLYDEATRGSFELITCLDITR